MPRIMTYTDIQPEILHKSIVLVFLYAKVRTKNRGAVSFSDGETNFVKFGGA